MESENKHDIESINDVRSSVLRTLDVPVISPSRQRIFLLLTEEEVEIGAVASAISEDPSLTAKIVGLANSAYFSRGNRVASVKEAIIKTLGLRTVKSITLSLLLGETFDVSRCHSFSLERYWSRALATAIYSQLLVQELDLKNEIDPDDAYLCGLLHDFGELLLAHLFPSSMDIAIQECRNYFNVKEILSCERDTLGVDHCEVGAWISIRWGLPETVVNLVNHYPYEERCRDKLCQVVRFTAFYVRFIELTGIAGIDDEDNFSDDIELLPTGSLDKEKLVNIIPELLEQHAAIKELALFLAHE